MKREIKFRAWDKKNKNWLTDKDTVYLNEEGEAFILVRGAASDYLSSVDVDIVRFTGLKDKNGVDIYEGDIAIDVLTKCHLQINFGYNRNGGYNGWYVSYLNIDRNGFSAINGDYDTCINSQIEIIGNIYENPELLKP